MPMTWNSIVSADSMAIPWSKVMKSGRPFCPDKNDIFKAFSYCSPDNCKVVFLGQDPYPQKGVATGILFANKSETLPEQLSPSLKVIKNSLFEDLHISEKDSNFDPSLISWAEQGILMINSALTVEMNKVGSHVMIWRPFISKLLRNLSLYNPDILFVLFGSQADTFRPYINKESTVLEIPHPAYSARTGKKFPLIFNAINEILAKKGKEKIRWI